MFHHFFYIQHLNLCTRNLNFLNFWNSMIRYGSQKKGRKDYSRYLTRLIILSILSDSLNVISILCEETLTTYSNSNWNWIYQWQINHKCQYCYRNWIFFQRIFSFFICKERFNLFFLEWYVVYYETKRFGKVLNILNT